MIKTFADRHTWEVFSKGKSKRIAPDIIRRAIRRLEYIDLATCLEDLKVPPGNRLHALKGDRKEQCRLSNNLINFAKALPLGRVEPGSISSKSR